MKCKLLVAEDELIERKVLCRTLQKYLGDLISLYEAKNGREALEIFSREAPQVAVLDIEMPGLTGLEVARKIRETDKNCAILFLTGFDKFDYARQAISVRALDYLLKPYNEQELVFAVEDAIRQVSNQSLDKTYFYIYSFSFTTFLYSSMSISITSLSISIWLCTFDEKLYKIGYLTIGSFATSSFEVISASSPLVFFKYVLKWSFSRIPSPYRYCPEFEKIMTSVSSFIFRRYSSCLVS